MNEKQKLKFAKCSECGSTDLECSFGEFIVGPKDSKVYSECKRVYTCKKCGHKW